MPKLSRHEIDEEMENSAEAAFAEEQRKLDERDAAWLQQRLDDLRLLNDRRDSDWYWEGDSWGDIDEPDDEPDMIDDTYYYTDDY